MMLERRAFLSSALKGVGLAAAAGLPWAGYVHMAKASPLVLRPPGALPESEFLAKCIKCGICVEDCPYGILRLAAPGEQWPLGTPYFIPREGPCRMCPDIPCVPACPTGALDEGLVSEAAPEEGRVMNVNLSRMGLAAIDRETCIAYWGMQCDVCYRACPLIDKALKVEYTRNERTGKHAVLTPLVDSEHCTGCGICERACITGKAAIFVLPVGLAQGKSDVRYLRGWSEKDERKLRDATTDTTTVTPQSERSPVDYLNQEF
jgi:ferredoxin-type protein NapG